MLKRYITYLLFIFFFPSCSVELIAVHDYFPFICFEKSCRNKQRMVSKNKREKFFKKLKKRKKQKDSKNKDEKSKPKFVKIDPATFEEIIDSLNAHQHYLPCCCNNIKVC